MFPESDLKFPSSKSNCSALNKWYIISVTWSNKKSLSNCWSNGIKIITFTSGDAKGSDYSFIGDLGRLNDSYNTYLSGCIGEIIGFHRSLKSVQSALSDLKRPPERLQARSHNEANEAVASPKISKKNLPQMKNS